MKANGNQTNNFLRLMVISISAAPLLLLGDVENNIEPIDSVFLEYWLELDDQTSNALLDNEMPILIPSSTKIKSSLKPEYSPEPKDSPAPKDTPYLTPVNKPTLISTPDIEAEYGEKNEDL